MKKKSVAVALGGGGVRSIAHIAVLEVLVEHGINPDVVVGTSAGSVIGALYCDNQDIERLKRLIIPLKRKDVMYFSFFNLVNTFKYPCAPSGMEKLELMLRDNLSTLCIEEFSVKYAAVASDLDSCQPYVFDRGDVIEAILASAALPPIFSPSRVNGRLLVDGGITNPVPVSIARRYKPDILIAININSPLMERSYGIVDVTMRSFMTSYYCLALEQCKHADFVIHPDMTKYGIFSDDHNEEIYQIGRAEALKVVPDILRALG